MAATDAQTGRDTGVVDLAAALARHARWLRTVVFARLGEAQAVDDVMQDVSLAALEQRAPLADPTKVAGWLYRLAVRHALMYRRRLGREKRRIVRYATNRRNESVDADPFDWLVRNERDQLIRQALDELPWRERELLLLKYTEDWSYREIANHLGLTESAVETRLHRARHSLRNRLARLSVTETKHE